MANGLIRREEGSPEPERPPGRTWVRRAALLWLFVLLAIAAGFLLRGGWSRLTSRGLPVYASLPDFSLIERSGGRITRADLLGKAWVADFFYSHCPDTCPLQTAEMARLQEDFASARDLRLVSISIDPERDTPKVLREYATRYKADPERWLFLTGEEEAVHRLVIKGFLLSVVGPQAKGGPAGQAVPSRSREGGVVGLRGLGVPTAGILGRVFLRAFGPAPAWAHDPDRADASFSHSSRFVLVDRRAEIRGYYFSDDAESLERLRRDLRVLLGRR